VTSLPLLFLRHGATALNAAGLRCGGDVDVPLTDLGQRQAHDAAAQLAAMQPRVGVIVVSDLQRTRQTAEIVARGMGGMTIVVEPAFDERALGAWNGLPIVQTQAELAAGVTPPGGESAAAFARRIEAAVVASLLPRLSRRVLLIASKGVARVLGELAAPAAQAARGPRPPLGNAELVAFDLGALAARRALACSA
jgi:2,3-bisphosphoglycerate-dependent phosphoglycerate mutase